MCINITTHPPECEKGWLKGLGEFVSFQSGASGRRPRLERKAGNKKGGVIEKECKTYPLPLLPTHNLRDNEDIRNSRIGSFCKGAQNYITVILQIKKT